MRPTLALLLDNLFDGYQEQLWLAMREACAARDANLFCFVGGAFATPVAGAELEGKNLVYELVPRFGVDGLLLVNGALGYHVGDDALRERLDALSPAPRVSVSRPLPGIPTVVFQDREAACAAVRHLVEVHGCRRIAHVAGPDRPESRARLEGYRDALAEGGLAFDPALVVPGDFSREAGLAAVRELLDVRRVPFDALFAANDYMALYAMRALQARGVRVPGDVRVVGFDDIADAVGAEPPLTTAAQPLREMGARAVDLLVRRLRSDPLPEIVPAAGHLVIRRSCGCAGAIGAPQEGSAPDPDELARALEAAHPWVSGAQAGGAAALARDLLAGAEVTEGARTRFLAALGELVGFHAAARARMEEEFKGVQRVFFPTDVSEEEVRRILVTQLPNLGVRSFYLSRFVSGDRRQARLLAHYGPADRVALEDERAPFDAGRLVPGRFSPEHRHAFAVLPVYSREDQLGFAVVELAPLSGGAYEALMNQISTAVRVSSLLEAQRSYADELERQVEERTRDLAGAQRQLLEAARHAGMAEIAVGALHNIGNLLTSVNVSASEIATRAGRSEVEGVRRTAALLAEHREDLAAFVAAEGRGPLVIEYLSKLAERLAAEQDVIRGEAVSLQNQVALIRETVLALQSYARQGDDLPLEPVDLSEVMETALRIQAPSLVRHGIRVHRSHPPLPTLESQRSKLLHVLVNVVKNAAEAMRAVPEERRVLTVRGRLDEGAVTLVFADEGEGIPQENLPRIFSYGFTTKPGGNGFGLHSCANTMRQLGGTILVESEGAGRGARVTLRFPVG
ncbi:MAG TPA: substrate-binding domain-containing protein [Anaeromyxobacter sp.]|nr:substrate-binding domain-containing protein [Anaeromyxobacter sp.]